MPVRVEGFVLVLVVLLLLMLLLGWASQLTRFGGVDLSVGWLPVLPAVTGDCCFGLRATATAVGVRRSPFRGSIGRPMGTAYAAGAHYHACVGVKVFKRWY